MVMVVNSVDEKETSKVEEPIFKYMNLRVVYTDGTHDMFLKLDPDKDIYDEDDGLPIGWLGLRTHMNGDDAVMINMSTVEKIEMDLRTE